MNTWDDVRRYADAIDVNADAIIDRAKRNGLSADEIVDRFERALEIREEWPAGTELSFEDFAATPPGLIDIRVLVQEGTPVWWLDILRSPHRIDDRGDFTDEHLDAVIDYLQNRAPELYAQALIAYPPLPRELDPQVWIETTPLWVALTVERECRQQDHGEQIARDRSQD